MMAGVRRSSSSRSESRSSDFIGSVLGAGFVVWAASKMPRFPSLSPAKMSALEGSGWKPSE